MLSPVVLGVKRSVATRFGWAGEAKVTWRDIAAKAKAGRLREPLELIYPEDGIITADYPLLLLDSAKRVAYDKLVAYLNRIRRPAHTIYVLDVSGSMEGDRIEALKQTLVNLAAADTSLTGRFASFRARERITMITFAGGSSTSATSPSRGPRPTPPAGAAIREYVAGLELHDGTAIFSAMRRAYQRAAADAASDKGSFTSIVLMTDGENNQGISVDDFLGSLALVAEPARSVKTFAFARSELDVG